MFLVREHFSETRLLTEESQEEIEPCRKIYILHLFSDIPVHVLVLDIVAKTLALLETTGHLEVGNGCHRQDSSRFFGTT